MQVDESTVTELDTTVEQAPTEPEPPAAVPRRGLSRKTRIRLLVILVLAILAAVFFLGRYLLDSANYVSTDNAQVDGNQISVIAPATGTLINWHGGLGASSHRGRGKEGEEARPTS